MRKGAGVVKHRKTSGLAFRSLLQEIEHPTHKYLHGRVTVVMRPEIDIEKLTKALVCVAKNITIQKRDEDEETLTKKKPLR